jgi:ribosomal protein S18 acetylase RimI-like enzyme
MIIRVLDEGRASMCDMLLTKLIQDERQYDNSIDKDFVVNNYFKNTIKNENNILLCYEEDNIIKGYIFIKPLTPNSKIGLIDGVYVDEEYRGKGIATKLINEAINMTKEEYNYMEINVMINNQAAYNLYKKLGFYDLRVTLRKDI